MRSWVVVPCVTAVGPVAGIVLVLFYPGLFGEQRSPGVDGGQWRKMLNFSWQILLFFPELSTNKNLFSKVQTSETWA